MDGIKTECRKCGDVFVEPEYLEFFSELGESRVFRSLPSNCPKCREEQLWSRVSEADRHPMQQRTMHGVPLGPKDNDND